MFRAPASRDPAPLVVALHGRYGTGEAQAKLTGLARLSEREGFLVVFADGIDRSWADDRGSSPASRQAVDDVAFIAAIIDRFVAEKAADSARVYVTGMSNGGIMTQTIGCKLADRVAAIAPVAGNMAAADLDTCAPRRPMSVLMFCGENDTIVPYQGGKVAGGGDVASAKASLGRWAALSGCAGGLEHSDLPDLDGGDGTTAVLDRAGGCTQGSEVELITIRGGGHTWPGGLQYLGEWIVGKTSRDVDANEEMWRFFQRHSR